MPSLGLITEGILPTLQNIPGYRGFIALSDPEGGQVMAISLWESEEALEAAEPLLLRIRSAETARGAESVTSTPYRVADLDLK